MKAKLCYSVTRTEEFEHDFLVNNNVITLNVYRDEPELYNEKGQLLYHFDVTCDFDELDAIIDAYKSSTFWEAFPLVL